MQYSLSEEQGVETKYLLLLIAIAYIFSFAMRMIWVYQFQGNPNFYWNDQLMINTNDGYTWAAGAQHILSGLHEHNSGIRDMWSNGVIFFTVMFTKVLPVSLETIILYMPAVISSLVVVPIILISRLFNQSLWGFFAALLGSIAWSYYNRTMVGYYDTDMFSAMAPMFILYFLMKSTIDFTPRSALYAAIAITLYPFLYDSGRSIVYAMGIIYAIYMIFYHRSDRVTYMSIVLVFIALVPLPIMAPFNYLLKVSVLIILYIYLEKSNIEQKKLLFISGVLALLFMYFGNVFGLIVGKVMSYIATGTLTEGLHFYGVKQTIREAGKIPFETFANRISGSELGVLISFLGYIVLVLRNRVFLLALPLVGIGIFALWGGLRFTVYVVPIAAMSAVYLFFVMSTYLEDKRLRYFFIIFATSAMIYPNITHIIGYKVPTVMNKTEVQDLAKLQEISNSKDYTLTWWDYGYPIWFYSNTNTIIDGGKHQNDNFIISKIMQTTSPEFAANLSRLAVETYVDSEYKTISNTLFKNGKEGQLDPNILLDNLEHGLYQLPEKTRDIYLYLPFRMLNIFPTVSVFGNLDLTTGKALRKMVFYPTVATTRSKDGILKFQNGMIFNVKKGELTIGRQKEDVKHFIVAQQTSEGNVNVRTQSYHAGAEYVVVYMKSYGRFVVMDVETFMSTYVQMFILGKYDKRLFELVVSSAYSKIYKLKK